MRTESWSGIQIVSALVAAGGLLSFILTGGAALRVYLGAYRIDALSADLLTLASVSGIGALVFGVWMCWRGLGFATFRIAAVVFGAIGVGAWPLFDYLST